MFRNCLVAARMALALLPAAASAQDLAGPAPIPEAKQPFTGPKIEALVGTDGDLRYGAAIGFDFRISGLVLGVEGEIGDNDGKDCLFAFSPEEKICSKTTRDLYVGGRIGVPILANTLLYGKIGHSNLRRRFTIEDAAGATVFRTHSDFNGVRFGAGLERLIGSRAYVKGEYRYTDYAGGRSHSGILGIGVRF